MGPWQGCGELETAALWGLKLGHHEPDIELWAGWMEPQGWGRGKQGQQCPLGQDTQQQHSWLWMNFLACFSSNLGKENMGWHTLQKGHCLPQCQAASQERFSSAALPASPHHLCPARHPEQPWDPAGAGTGESTPGQPALPSCMVLVSAEQGWGAHICSLLWAHIAVPGRGWPCSMSAPCASQHEGTLECRVQSVENNTSSGGSS